MKLYIRKNIACLAIIWPLVFHLSCLTTKLWCAGCKLSDAYQDPKAMKLVKAAISGDSKEVEVLIQAGANPNYIEPGKVPPLIWTICAQNIQGYEALLKAGADPNLGGTGHGKGHGNQGGHGVSILQEGWSAMVFAASDPDPRYLRLAIEHGGDLNAEKTQGKGGPEPSFPLLLASYYGLFDNIKILVAAGADINIHHPIYSYENGPENAIAVKGRFDIAIWYLENGYNYNLPSLATAAEFRLVNEKLQPYKEKLIDMLIARGMKFPNPKGIVAKAMTVRQIPESDLMDLVYGRKRVFDYPMKPGMVDDRYK